MNTVLWRLMTPIHRKQYYAAEEEPGYCRTCKRKDRTRVWCTCFHLTTMKGIPLAYNKDMQEDKEVTFDAIDTVKDCHCFIYRYGFYHGIP